MLKNRGTDMWLFAGLGNPGLDYSGTRHNAGFMVMDALAARLSGTFVYKKKFRSDCAEVRLDGHKVMLVKPMTYMNHSGSALQAVSHFYNIPLERLVVFHDDLALAVTKIRVKKGGGSAGHNGLKDIDAHLGSDYIRVRIGVHHPGERGAVSDYVLSPFTADERMVIDQATDEMAQCSGLLLDGKYDLFMTRVVETIRKKDHKQEQM